MPLNLMPNIENPDGFYNALLSEHDGLTAEQSAAYNARLVLILANQIGKEEALQDALIAARPDRSEA